jgi:hypothetical protein
MRKINLMATALLAGCAVWAQPALPLKARLGKDRRPSRAAPAESTHFILQFPDYPDARTRRDLEERGLRVLEYVPGNALLVAGPKARIEGLAVSWAGTLEAPDKISPDLDRQTGGPLLVEFHRDVSMERARATVGELGFDVIENPGLLAGQLVVTGPAARIEALAGRDAVKYILPAAPELAAGEVMVGCAGALTEAGLVGDYVLVGTGWPKDQSGNVALKYFIRSLPGKLDANTARSEIERALAEWTRYANVTLLPGRQEGRGPIDRHSLRERSTRRRIPV